MQQGQNATALEMLSRAVAVDPKSDWRYRCTMGQVFVSLERLDEAETEYRRAADLERQNRWKSISAMGLAAPRQRAADRGNLLLSAGCWNSIRSTSKPTITWAMPCRPKDAWSEGIAAYREAF